MPKRSAIYLVSIEYVKCQVWSCVCVNTWMRECMCMWPQLWWISTCILKRCDRFVILKNNYCWISKVGMPMTYNRYLQDFLFCLVFSTITYLVAWHWSLDYVQKPCCFPLMFDKASVTPVTKGPFHSTHINNGSVLFKWPSKPWQRDSEPACTILGPLIWSS